MQIFKGVAFGKQSFREHCATKQLLEANPRNISASKISRYTVIISIMLLYACILFDLHSLCAHACISTGFGIFMYKVQQPGDYTGPFMQLSCQYLTILHIQYIVLLTLSLPFVKSGTGASLGRSISVDPASPRLQVILLV